MQDIKVWVDQDQMKVNDSKTELIGWHSQLEKYIIEEINVNGETYKGLASQDTQEHIKTKCKAAMTNIFKIKTSRKISLG